MTAAPTTDGDQGDGSRALRRRRTVRAVVAGLAVALLAVPGALTAAGVLDLGRAPRTASSTWDNAASDDWPTDAVIYHVFVDRFADGGDDTGLTQVAGSPADPDYADALTDWMGGDLPGLEARLDHIVATGANTIWISPVSEGPFFHGYHPTDLLDVDPRFGDLDALRSLVTAAHERGLKVVYDLVLNHTSDQHPWFRAAQADCAGSAYVEWYEFSECPDSYAAFAGLPELPQLDLDHPPAREWVFDEVLPLYLDDIGVDGFRLDHVQGPSRDFWRAFDAELASRWPDTFVLGEVWASLSVIESYGDVLDAATAFPLRDRLLATFAQGGDVRAVAMPVAASLEPAADAPFGTADAADGASPDGTDAGSDVDLDAGSDALTARLRPLDAEGPPWPQTYLSSHDQPRFAHLADGERARLALAQTAILTLPGVPTIYYGDEVGLAQTDALPDGAPFADRWFREPMPWDPEVWSDWSPWDEGLRARIASVARLRTTTSALTNAGSYTEVVGTGDVWVYLRSDPGGRAGTDAGVTGEANTRDAAPDASDTDASDTGEAGGAGATDEARETDEAGTPRAPEHYLVAINNGEVAVDLREVLRNAAEATGSQAGADDSAGVGADTGARADLLRALLAALDGAEVVLAPAGWPVGADDGAAGADDGGTEADDGATDTADDGGTEANDDTTDTAGEGTGTADDGGTAPAGTASATNLPPVDAAIWRLPTDRP